MGNPILNTTISHRYLLNKNEERLQSAMAKIEAVAMFLEEKHEYLCYAQILHESVKQLCELKQ